MFRCDSLQAAWLPLSRTLRGPLGRLSGYVGNHAWMVCASDGDIVIVVAAYALGRLHHPADFKSGNGWLAHGKKHSLNARRSSHPEEGRFVRCCIVLASNSFWSIYAG